MLHIQDKKISSDRERAPVRRYFFVLCMAYFIIPIDIVGNKVYNPIMFVGIVGITGESPDLSGDNIYFSEA